MTAAQSLSRQNRGQIRILEAFLAVLLVSSALLLSSGFSQPETVEKDTQLESIGMQLLMQLDENSRLWELIDERNWTKTDATLREVMPFGIVFNFTIYDESGNTVNDVTVSNGVLAAERTVAVEYLCASRDLECQFYIVRLQLSKTR